MGNIIHKMLFGILARVLSAWGLFQQFMAVYCACMVFSSAWGLCQQLDLQRASELNNCFEMFQVFWGPPLPVFIKGYLKKKLNNYK